MLNLDSLRVRKALLLPLVFGAGFGIGGYRSSQAEVPAEVLRVRGVEPPSAVSPAQTSAETARVGAEAPASPGRTVAASALSITAVVRGDHVYGAGIVIDRRHVLTCRHVIEGLSSITVTLADGAPEPARVVDSDAKLDLAVLELSNPAVRAAQLASATGLQMGDRVYAMGVPKNLTFSFNSGMVSYLGRSYDEVVYLQTDMPTNPGNSGGPVLDEQGRVVAVASFILRETQGLAFAIPIDYAHRRFREYFAAELDTREFDAWLGTHETSASRSPRSTPR